MRAITFVIAKVKIQSYKEYIGLNASKVILLSATPYNKSYSDLSNQLRLFIDDDADLGQSPENFIREIGGKVEFVAKYQYSERTLLAFEKSDYSDDWRELMRLYLVRRTRSFIKENYSIDDPVKNVSTYCLVMVVVHISQIVSLKS